MYSSLQVRYGKEWSNYVGGNLGDLEEIFLFPGESISQVSGKYRSYLQKVVFVPFGRDNGTSFNGAPLFSNTALRYLSSRSGSIIDAIGFHWDKYPCSCSTCRNQTQQQEVAEREQSSGKPSLLPVRLV
ncbi:zymogen granule membrane protein 16 [Crotalus adamanteus]|uniref:Zymogen granule membrane protein 16 n=1 Tax=Crotalus adamanteus TaxID=8729 RepID=A0AAW1B0V0_CROAD